MELRNRRPASAGPGLSRQDLDPNPFKQFEHWFHEAIEAEPDLPNAMTVATATKEGLPSARMVLLKDFDEAGFLFYTNYDSRKGRELAENPHAALLFYWGGLRRQVRVEGRVGRVSREMSEAYFRTRPTGSQISAWASRQSRVIDNRAVLVDQAKQSALEFEGQEVPRPSNWGGFRVVPHVIEFWQNRPDRLHDRFRYSKLPDKGWLIERLSP